MSGTIANATGFEINDLAAYGVGAGTTPTISTAHPRHGARALKCAATAGKSSLGMTNTNNQFGWSATNRTCYRFGLYVETMPGITSFVFLTNNIILEITSGGVLSLRFANGGATGTGDAFATVTTGSYHVIEIEVDCATASNWVGRWRVDNNVQTNATYTGSATTPSQSTVTFGIPASGSNATFIYHFDDFALSSTAADYPLGNGYNVAYPVNACGTHNINTGAFQDDGGSAVTAGETTSFSKIADATPDTGSYVKQTTSAGSNYLEYALTDTGSPSDTPQFVRAAHYSAVITATVANGAWKLHDGTTDTTLSVTASNAFNYREIKQATRAGAQGAWTTAAIDALTMRVGFNTANPATATVLGSFAIIEVDYAASYAITDNESYAGTVTPAGALAKETDKPVAGTASPAGAVAAGPQASQAGTVTPSGSLSIITSHVLTAGGTITPVGTLSGSPAHGFAGTVTPVGSLATASAPTGFGGSIFPRGGSPLYAAPHVLTNLYGTIIKRIDVLYHGKCTPLVVGRIGAGGTPGTGDGGTPPGPGDGTSDTGGGSTTLIDCPCIVHLDIGGGLSVVVGRAVTSGPRARNLLGCGTYQVFATTRGGRSIIVEIPYTSLEWGRVLSDTSTASITAQGVSGISDACARGLALLRPRKHEIAIYRSSYLVWAGPISGPLKVEGDTLTIPAADLSSWFDRRRIRRTIQMTADLSDVFVAYVDAAMESDPSPRLLIEGGQSGVVGQRSVLAAAHELAGPLLRELAEAGVAWTVERRTLHYGLPVTPPLPVTLLIDDSYVAQPDVEIIDIAANDLIVAGQGTGEAGDTIYGYARDAASQAEYGLLDAVYRESLILDATSAQERAEDDLALVRVPPTIVNGGTLTPFAPVLIDQLVPGVQIDNRLLTSLFPVAGPFQLTKLQVSAGNDGSEQVAVTFQPVASAS